MKLKILIKKLILAEKKNPKAEVFMHYFEEYANVKEIKVPRTFKNAPYAEDAPDPKKYKNGIIVLCAGKLWIGRGKSYCNQEINDQNNKLTYS